MLMMLMRLPWLVVTSGMELVFGMVAAGVPHQHLVSFVNIFMIAMKIRPDHDAGADHDL